MDVINALLIGTIKYELISISMRYVLNRFQFQNLTSRRSFINNIEHQRISIAADSLKEINF